MISWFVIMFFFFLMKNTEAFEIYFGIVFKI